MVSGVNVIPVPDAKVKVSVLLDAAIDVESDLIVLKIFWDDPVSLLVIVRPETEMPVPAAKVSAPVLPPSERTPVFDTVGFVPVPTDIPDPAVKDKTAVFVIVGV